MSQPRFACVLPVSSISGCEPAIESLAEACGRYSPKIAIRNSHHDPAVFLEIGGSRSLFSEDSLKLRLPALARRLGKNVRVGFADSPSLALLNARWPGASAPLEALAALASPFAHDPELVKKIRNLNGKLALLGIHDVQGFSSLPRTSLASRFGKDIQELSLRARGELQSVWPQFEPPRRIFEKAEIEECTGLEPLLFVMRGMLDHLTARLRGRTQRICSLRVEMEIVKWSALKDYSREWLISFSFPQGSTIGILPILRERLAHDLARSPLQAPVAVITIEVLESVPGNASQRDFFEKGEVELEDRENILLERLSQRLGKSRVFQAKTIERHLPEKAWTRILKQTFFRKNPVPPGSPAGRPSRVLKKPESLLKMDAFLIHPHNGKRWRVTEWEGPERISPEWWEEWWEKFTRSGHDRDYFRVSTDLGEKLWVFTGESGVFLHGYFD